MCRRQQHPRKELHYPPAAVSQHALTLTALRCCACVCVTLCVHMHVCGPEDKMPPESELRAALEELLQGADMTTVSYSQLHKQLEAKFKVREGGGEGDAD